MTYNIFSSTAPAMPKPSKGTEIVKLLLSQASKDMHEPLVPMLFPILGTAAAYRKVYMREIRYRSMKKAVLFCKIGRIRLQQENKGSDMPYLCIVFGKQASEPVFADSPSRHVHTPGTRTCRLRRQRSGNFGGLKFPNP